MTAQGIAVALIVPSCALVAVWLLIGAGTRRRIAARLAAWPLPAAWRRRLVRPPQQVVRIHRRPRQGAPRGGPEAGFASRQGAPRGGRR